MTVFVDDMYRDRLGQYQGMKMSHMLADTESELIAMATRIGLRLAWHQYPGTHRSHFDIAMSKRRLAITHGAVAVEMRVLSAMRSRRRLEGVLGDPSEALRWRREVYPIVITRLRMP